MAVSLFLNHFLWQDYFLAIFVKTLLIQKPRRMAQYYKFDKERASRKPGVTPLKEAIEHLFGKPHMKRGFEESYVTAHWAKIMGHPISSRTQKVYVRDRILFLQIESAPLRNELVLAKKKIIELINREMKVELIEDVVFI